MTISNTTRFAGPFVGNGTASSFGFSFKVFSASDLAVYRTVTSTGIATTLALTTDYTVALNADQDSSPGGTVTLVAGNLASGLTLVIASAVPNTQQVILTNQGGFYPEVLNDALDKATAQVQQVQAQANRSISFPAAEVSAVGTLPIAVDRAGQYLAFDANGNVDIGGAVPDQRYYGGKTADPTTRNDGTAMQAGDLYYNTASNAMKVYSGTAWIAFTSAVTDGNKGDVVVSGGGATWTLDSSIAISSSLTVGGQNVGPRGVSTNSVIGTNAGNALTTGANNVLVGNAAGSLVTTGSRITAVGTSTTCAAGTNDGVAVGHGAVAAGQGVAVGNYALFAGSATTDNVAVGHGALGLATANCNVAVGMTAGDSITSGINNVVLGCGADVAAATNNNSIVIGYQAVGGGSNTTVIGNASTTNTTLPAGNLTITNGNVVLADTKGIDFSATAGGSGTPTSEILTDFEEGTWAPVYEPATGAFTTMTMDVVGARYTKIGKMVIAIAMIRTDNVSVGTASGNLFISGFPYAQGDNIGGGSISNSENWSTNHPIALRAEGLGSTRMLLLFRNTAGNSATGVTQVSHLTTGATADRNQIIFSAIYMTA
jgi:hypothetical protein